MPLQSRMIIKRERLNRTLRHPHIEGHPECFQPPILLYLRHLPGHLRMAPQVHPFTRIEPVVFSPTESSDILAGAAGKL